MSCSRYSSWFSLMLHPGYYLHASVLYFRKEGNYNLYIFASLSNKKMKNNPTFIFQKTAMTHTWKTTPQTEKLKYFRADAVNKSYNNLVNICHYKDDHVVWVEWYSLSQALEKYLWWYLEHITPSS